MSATTLYERFPKESAIVLQRNIETSCILSCLLMTQCALLLWNLTPSDLNTLLVIDAVLWGLFVVRLCCLAFRPYSLFRAYQRLTHARRQPTPQLMAKHLVDVHTPDRPAVKAMQHLLYVWLVSAFVAACAAEMLGSRHADLAPRIRRHCFLNGIALLVQKVICFVVFVFVSKKSGPRGIAKDALESCTERFVFEPSSDECLKRLGGGDMECSICLAGYSSGEEIRKLSCRHHFHQSCLDNWLLEHKNRCPLCLDIVGPRS